MGTKHHRWHLPSPKRNPLYRGSDLVPSYPRLSAARGKKCPQRPSPSRKPSQNQSLGDLALAQLIIGDTEPGLAALHAAQTQFEKSGDRALLVQSLENELRLLEHEHRDTEVTAIQSRITQLERL